MPAGTAFINLSLGFRLSNRNQCVMQGFAFLYKYQRLVNFNQVSVHPSHGLRSVMNSSSEGT